jgi:FMN phosphatase YigB (HAD superfamily)
VLRRLLGDAGLLPCFDFLAFSDEAGVRKPAPAIFHRVLDQAGTDPAGAVHVGDDAVTDVAGARGVGMRAIHYVPDPSAPPAAADGVLRRFADLPRLVSRFE